MKVADGELIMKTAQLSIIAGLAAFMVVFFQNCGKPPSATSTGENTGLTSEETGGNSNFNKIQIAQLDSISLWDEARQRFLNIDVSSGSIQAFEQAGRIPGATYQLSPEQQSSLSAILSQAEACEPVDKAQKKYYMCTMVYGYPYATLISSSQELKLGEKASGCDVPVDLCGEKAQQLKSWSQAVVDGL